MIGDDGVLVMHLWGKYRAFFHFPENKWFLKVIPVGAWDSYMEILKVTLD